MRQNISNPTRCSQFIQLTLATWLYALIGIIIFTLLQTITLYTYQTPHLWQQFPADIAHGYYIGFLFNLKTMTFALVPFYVLGMCLCTLKHEKTFRYFNKIYQVYAVFILVLCLFIGIANYYYYSAFEAHFNFQLFAIQSAKITANLLTIWNEYPLLTIFIILLLSALLISLITTRLLKSIALFKPGLNWLTKIIITALAITLYIGALRGSYSLFPQRYSSTFFSSSNLINQTTLNGPTSLYYAFMLHKQAVSPVNVSLQKGLRAYNDFFKTSLTLKNFNFNQLFTHTKTNPWLAKHPPNVVFVQMESMGNQFLNYQNDKTENLLGQLEPYYKKNLVFRYFLSGGNGTDPSSALFFVNSPLPEFFIPPLSLTSYDSSIAKPFKKAGYNCIFLTSVNANVRNNKQYLPLQGFDDVYGKNTVLNKYPHAETEPWGVYDGYMFKYAEILLKQANAQHKPLFLYINTVTNHPPYTIPKSYHPLPITEPKGLAHFMRITHHKAKMMLLSYQYANNQLGQFIHHTSTATWGHKTIIGASGDHNQHEMMPHYTDPHTFFLQHSVPFILHVPKAYLKTANIDTNRLGSHKDIFPTLFNLALSNARYENTGNNLLAATPTNGFYFGVNPGEFLIKNGIIIPGTKPMFYPWTDKKTFAVGNGQPLPPKINTLYQRITAYQDLIYWQFEWQAYRELNHLAIYTKKGIANENP